MTARARLVTMLAVAAALLASDTAAAAKAKRVPFGRAVTFAEWGKAAYQPAQVRATLGRLKRRQRVDTITLLVVWSQEDERSVRVRRGDITASDRNIRSTIRIARRLGMRVILRPYVDRIDGGWRGQIAPASVDAWFASYGRFIRRYATLARRERAEGFVVGSEMGSLSGEEAHWRALVRSVRKRFRGWVTYQANWGGEETSVLWWDAVDAISISAYYPLAAGPGRSVGELAAGWTALVDQHNVSRRWFATIDGLRRRYRKPVIFGEVGYRPVPATAVEPWNVALGGSDARAQSRAYEATLRVWYRVPWFRGLHWWYVTPNDAGLDGHFGADHRLGPAALRSIARWYRRPPR